MAENVMMKRIYHVSRTPKDGVMTYVIDAHAAVRDFPDQWAFQPWPVPVAAVALAAEAVPTKDWRKEIDWKATAAKGHATKRRKLREAREAAEAEQAPNAA